MLIYLILQGWHVRCLSVVLVVYDPNRLNHLVSKTVDRTQGYTVEKIERLYNLLCRCIYERRRDYNKAALIQVRA